LFLGDLTDEQLEEALNSLVSRVENQQNKALTLLQTVYSTFSFFATDFKSEPFTRGEDIKQAIRTYFTTETLPPEIPLLPIEVSYTNTTNTALSSKASPIGMSFLQNHFA